MFFFYEMSINQDIFENIFEDYLKISIKTFVHPLSCILSKKKNRQKY